MLLGIDHVQVAAPIGSEGEARRFYGELLGLPELPKPPVLQARGGVWFVCGAHQLHVGVSEPFSPASKAHPAFQARLADLDRLAARLEEAGAPVQWDDAIPGTRRFYTADPWATGSSWSERTPDGPSRLTAGCSRQRRRCCPVGQQTARARAPRHAEHVTRPPVG